ncbi:uncharacterized protein SPPG_06659 [Spizellomyces punctatus DAOM BR117]|uniref:chitin synthase n=1 Tax=Spizellomyces punctatus (strain DAOM BR117) TaxID=645134 RepID=A0A0L0HBE8_SPIPD|nr:uncharacterized protein SPPG_06659 [Spizellomyces punctatus DAOM BR117]KNC98261.1 hypothetical protein SPPG_06659 [Spizellomyces punctatus DAOM BR117]|eukprot:XP_016606301.1 hypothetical protein SPPG_06659 [Spizellomyces punctatus DAOM BR117]
MASSFPQPHPLPSHSGSYAGTDIDDLALLSATSSDAIVSHLSARASRGQNYTACGSDCLVAVSSSGSQERVPDEQVENFAATFKSLRGNSIQTGDHNLPAHVWRLAANAYEGVVKAGEDQSVVFSGESGGGKSECRKLFLRQLVALGKTPKKKSRVLSGAVKMETVLEAFGHARLPHSPNASRFGRYTEYQYDSAGKMIGVKLLEFLLDRRRVALGADAFEGERNFNIFYQMLAGSSSEDKDRLGLSSDPSSYHYLGGMGPTSRSTLGRSGTLSRKTTLPRKGTLTRALSLRRNGTIGRGGSNNTSHPIHNLTSDDTEKYEYLGETLKSLGVGRRAQAQLTDILAAILHLGNVTFQDDPDHPNEACTVKNTTALDLAADLLGVSPTHLETTLTYKSKLVKRELCSVMLNSEGAEQQRDTLARALYSGLFAWVVEHLNRRLCKEEGSVASFISVLDFPGQARPDEPLMANFDDFLSNYANERLLRHVQKLQFGTLYAELASDGVNLSKIAESFPDNGPILRMLTGGKTGTLDGILPVLEEESQRATDDAQAGQRFGNTLNTHLAANTRFVPGSRCPPALLPPTSTGGPPDDLSSLFGIRHYFGDVTYDATQFVERNTEILDADFVTLFRGITTEDNVVIQAPSKNAFAAHLFSSKVGVATQSTPKHPATIVSARRADRPLRRPSTKRRRNASPKDEVPEDSEKLGTVSGTFVESLEEVLDAIKGTKAWTVYCIRGNDGNKEFDGGVDMATVRRQVNALGIQALAELRSVIDVSVKGMEYDAFVGRYAPVIGSLSRGRDPKSIVNEFLKTTGCNQREVAKGNSKVFLSDAKWKWLDLILDEREQEVPLAATAAAAVGGYGQTQAPPSISHPSSSSSSKRGSVGSSSSTVGFAASGYGPARQGRPRVDTQMTGRERPISAYSEDDGYSDSDSVYGSEFSYGAESAYEKRRSKAYMELEMGKISGTSPLPPKHAQSSPKPKRKSTATRRNWVCITWCLTWWIPSPFLRWCGGMQRPDVRMAWREKVALCILIMAMSLALLFFIIGLSWIVCPPQRIRTPDEIASMSSNKSPYVSAYGRYYDVKDLMSSHLNSFGTGPAAIHDYDLEPLYGNDVSNLFFRTDQWDQYCEGFTKPQAGWDNIDPTPANQAPWSTRPRDMRLWHRATDPDGGVRQYVEYMNKYAQGRVGWSMERLNSLRSNTKIYVRIYSNVYYLTTYFNIAQRPFSPTATGILDQAPNTLDLTSTWNNYRNQDRTEADRTLRCLNAMFYIGTVDTRNTAACRFTNWVLVAASIILVAVIGFKFVAALQFRSKKDPEECDKFVMCLVTAYTEGEDELRKTIESIAVNKYDDRRKLLFVVADGMIVGSGNDRPTPRIVLDILGVDPAVDPEPLAFRSLGAGTLQYNLAKVYSGLYEIRGHRVPFIVVTKVGAPHERVKPGNRGKRDSQLILMRWLSRVHYGAEMTPLELELWFHVERIIGIRPEFYEYILMVDADTCVDDRAINGLISFMVDDAKVMGLCGETRLSNEKTSWVTMIQVYEYFISHHLSKAFESLFGTVTCLPGCFCMYRIRTPPSPSNPSTPLLVSEGVLHEYSENNVDTLHMKNLLSLGEDRYLTTVMLKNFPGMRTSFTPSAKCTTTAPDRWSVLLSQRRRWINSTVHNLLELTTLKDLCGFCCFSMRFVVVVDLVATFVQPAAVIYIGYLIFLLATGGFSRTGGNGMVFPVLSVVLIAAIYGFQVIIFVLRRQWQHIAWMIIYLLSLPVFSFFIPLYSFWHFDDFSWGNTRVVMGDGRNGKKTKKMVEVETGKFDERLVPLAKWDDARMGKRHSWWDSGEHLQSRNGSRESFYATSVNGGYPVSGYGAYPPSNYAPSYHAPSNYAPSQYGGPEVADPHDHTYVAASPAPPRSSFSSAQGPRLSFSSSRPSSESLLSEIRRILSTADLMTVTKKQVRDELSNRFGIDLRTRKEEINGLVDEVLQEMSGM